MSLCWFVSSSHCTDVWSVLKVNTVAFDEEAFNIILSNKTEKHHMTVQPLHTFPLWLILPPLCVQCCFTETLNIFHVMTTLLNTGLQLFGSVGLFARVKKRKERKCLSEYIIFWVIQVNYFFFFNFIFNSLWSQISVEKLNPRRRPNAASRLWWGFSCIHVDFPSFLPTYRCRRVQQEKRRLWAPVQQHHGQFPLLLSPGLHAGGTSNV